VVPAKEKGISFSAKILRADDASADEGRARTSVGGAAASRARQGAIRIKRLIFFDSGSAKQQTTAGIGVSVNFRHRRRFQLGPAPVGRAKNSRMTAVFLLFLQFRNNFRGSIRLTTASLE